MKNTSKVLGFAAIVAAIALMILPLTGCDTPAGGGTETETKVATPTASPASGEVTSGTTVTLQTTTSGANIWYTLDGSTTPTKNASGSTRYTTAITITANTTIKAIAVKDGLEDSEVLTATYTLQTGGTSSANAIVLTEDQWADGSIVANGEQWFKFTSTATTQYIHFRPGTRTGANIQLYNADGTTTVGTSAYISTSYVSRTVTNETVYYIKVSYTSAGTYQIGFNKSSTPPPITLPTTDLKTLTADAWTDGNLTTVDSEEWFKFTSSTATGSATTVSQYIHLQPGTLTDVNVQVYGADGKTVGTASTNLWYSALNTYRTLTVDTDYYIRVTRNAVTSSGGEYKIGFNTTSASPVVITTTPTATELTTADAWTDGTLTAGGEQWFKFTSTATSQYIHFLPGTLTDVYVQLFTSDGRFTGNRSNLDRGTPNISRTVSNNNVYYIKVTPYSSIGSGTYKIGFNTASTSPVVLETMPTSDVTELTAANTWVNGNITTAGSEQWFKFTSTATSQYIYFQAGTTLTDVYVQLYTADGRMVGGRSWLYTGTYSAYASRSVTNSTVYYIKVTSYNSTGTKSTGEYKLGFGTAATLPTP
jgi:hypothetical protein